MKINRIAPLAFNILHSMEQSPYCYQSLIIKFVLPKKMHEQGVAVNKEVSLSKLANLEMGKLKLSKTDP